jgi:hypothetical protein
MASRTSSVVAAAVCGVLIAVAGATGAEKPSSTSGPERVRLSTSSTLDTVFRLPDVEVTAHREKHTGDSASVRTSAVRAGPRASGLPSGFPGRKPPVYRRWWVWGALGTTAAVLVYGVSSRRDTPKGSIRVVVGEMP